MTEQQLEWVPWYIDLILSSPRWKKMRDFQRGWYMQLLLLCTRSERIGYLKLDERLWELAGAHRREMWEQHSSAVMACFKTRTFDAQCWIYNERLLKTISEQNAKRNKRVKGKEVPENIDLSVSISEVASALEVSSKESTINEIYKSYPRKVSPRAAKKAIGQALTRLLAGKEAPAELFQTVDDAAVFLSQRVRLFAMSPAGQAGEFTPYPATWFNGSRYLDDESEWSRHGESRGLTKTQQRYVDNTNIIDADLASIGIVRDAKEDCDPDRQRVDARRDEVVPRLALRKSTSGG